jgi:flavodoxin
MSKRTVVVTALCTVLAAVVVLFAIPTGSTEANAQTGNDKILIAFFSWSGNAKALAGQIAQETGGNLFEIKTVTPYPTVYDECIQIAKQELENNARPVLSGSVADMNQYSKIILCYPIWYGTSPMAVFTFLEAYDFSNMAIYLLATHGSSRLGRSVDDIKRITPKAVVGEALAVSARDRDPLDAPAVKTPNKDVTEWLRRIGMIQ